MARSDNKRWVVRDLSNGDGADGRKYPTYVWVCGTRREARRLKGVHRGHDFARLGPVEQWSNRVLCARYETAGSRSSHPFLKFLDASYCHRIGS